MRKIKSLFLTIILHLWIITVCAQIPEPVFNVPTPDAANLGAYGEIPVGHYTGIPDISIPLYEIKLENITVPIAASYHLASVKPNTPITTLGLGWSLISGGCITRTVRGVYDEKCYVDGRTPGYYSNSSKMKNITPDNFKMHTENIHSTGLDPYYELVADEFSFNFCGYSGNFYYNENGEWSVASEQDIKVVFDSGDGFINLKQLAQHPFMNLDRWGRKKKTIGSLINSH